MSIDDDLDRVELLVKVAEQLLDEYLARRATEVSGGRRAGPGRRPQPRMTTEDRPDARVRSGLMRLSVVVEADWQMRGLYRVREPRLQVLHAEARALVTRLETVRFEWVPRERNRRADALANRAVR